MTTLLSRRDILKTGLAAAGALILPRGMRAESAPAVLRERLLLDFDWKFHLGHAADPAQDFGYGIGRMYAKTGDLFAPSRANFNDAAWRSVNLPHDWAVELPFVENARELIEFGSKPLGRAYPATSIGWYRRVFDVPASDAGRRLSLEFDGVFRDAIVALNGQYLGRNLSGYAPFRYDITDFVNPGGKNVLVVRVDATGREGWFYEGAGIYRHVWLVKTPPVHVAHWGTFVTSEVAASLASVRVATQVDNDGDQPAACRVVHTIQDADGRDVATSRPGALTIAGRGTAETVQQLTVSRPSLWSVETPYRYRVVTTVESNGREVDHYETPFGIRTMRFDANDGFLLNGRRVELKGTCNHQDHAGVGAALPDAIQYYRIQQLKEMGSNAYRTSHNPPTPELLEACDALGMLVLDETRMFSSEAEGLSQLERMIRRDRNHPCIVAWSIFNEEWGEQGTERGARLAATMKAAAHRLDPTRPVTAAMDGAWGGPVTPVLDVQGCNYERPNRPETNLESFRRNNPRKPVFGSEVASTYCTRGVYTRDAAAGYVSAYDVNKPSYGATAEEWWTRFAARPWLAGGFVWTGFDYRGEPSPYAWPCISSHFGIMDTCGFPKDNFFYYQAWWGDKPVLHLFPHWNWPGRDGEQIEVWVHANVERVELLLNDRSLGAQEMPRNGHLVWHVPYAPGRLVARGFTDGRQVLERVRATPGAAARIVFSADRAAIAADGEDAAVVTARVTDNAGLEVATANHLISFTVTGSGKLIGVGNGDPSSHESDKAPERRAFNGLCCAIVQASKQAGAVRVKATSPGLAPAEIAITCSPAKPRASA